MIPAPAAAVKNTKNAVGITENIFLVGHAMGDET
jgi:hypothetical protein